MGIEGAVLAVGALFLLAYVVPHIARNRAVLADAPIGERYADELRIITERTLRQASGDNGRIFTTERIMSTPTGKREQRGPNATKMRAIARDRSRARARIAQREAAQQRALFGAAVFVGLTVILWILAGATSLPTGIAIASTALGGLYLVGLGAVVSSWGRLNHEDTERISRANHALRSGRDYQRKLVARTKNDADIPARPQAPAKNVAKKRATSAEAERVEETSEAVAVASPTPRVERVVQDAPAQESPRLFEQPRDRSEAPSYTLKPTIQRRSIKPYVAPEAPEAEVPYRPSQVGERIGPEPLEAANPTPGTTGAEELRSDVLGGGSTLDALLDRRRA